jgi:hypothetical protein
MKCRTRRKYPSNTGISTLLVRFKVDKYDQTKHVVALNPPPGALNVVFQITCPTARTVPIFIGTGGRCVASLCQKTESELRNLFRCDLKIKIIVTSTKPRKS